MIVSVETIVNGAHRFAFPWLDPTSPHNHPNLGKCQGPCRLIVTRREAEHRQFGACEKPKENHG